MIRIAMALMAAVLVFASCGSAGNGEGGTPRGNPDMPYMEKMIDGRIYIAGTEEGMQKLENGEKLAIARTLVGEGPNRESLVFEVSKDDEQLDERLEAEYRARHGVMK